MDQQARRIYEFGDFHLDAQRRVLSSRVDGQPIPVTAKVFDTLLYLIEHSGRVLEKSVLMDALWPNVVVEESNLTQTIHTLRRLLGERPDQHRYIVTVPGRGYRFVAEVRVRPLNWPEPGVHSPPEGTHRLRRYRLMVALGVVALAMLATAMFVIPRWPGATHGKQIPLPAAVVAVLPFVDMSPQHDQEYFSDGLSEEILNLLAQSPELLVIARTSSFSFKGEKTDIATIADKLKVTHVLEGSVRRSGERVRITAQLVDGATSAHVWSQTYERDARDIFGVQAEIAAAVAHSLQVTLTGGSRPEQGETTIAEAYEHFLRGRYFFNRRGASDVARARDYFERAVQLDPGYARAWTGLAGVYYAVVDRNKAIPEANQQKWHQAVEQAIALGPNLAEAHIRAAQYYWVSGDARAADLHFKQAMVLNPSDPLVLGTSAGTAAYDGRLDEAISLQLRAVATDPLMAIGRANLGAYLAAAEQWEEAKRQFALALDLSPTMLDLNAEIVRILILQHRLGQARRTMALVPQGALREQCLALLNHAAGHAGVADDALARLIAFAEVPDSDASLKLAIAEVHAFRGANDDAFEWLDRANQQTRDIQAVEPGSWTRQEAQLSPFLKPLRADPRWHTLLAGRTRSS